MMNRTIAALILLAAIVFAQTSIGFGQEKPQRRLEIKALTEEGRGEYSEESRTFVATNGIMVVYGDLVLTADRARGNMTTGEIVAEGHVRLQRDQLVWVGENIRYNFLTLQMESEQFRTGYPPVFAGGERVGTPEGDRGVVATNYSAKDTLRILTNQVYTGRNAFVTTDDIANPGSRVRASAIKVVPGKWIEARNAVLYLGKVPVFYFPYYKQRLDGQGNRFNFVPGFRSSYGPFLLSSYTWVMDEHLDGVLRADYREKRGGAGGLDLNGHLGRWGEATFKGYYLYDEDPTRDNAGYDIPNNRYRFDFGYSSNPYTNLYVKSRVRYASDPRVLENFFEGEYRRNPQPNTFVEVNQLWDNFSLDVFSQVQVNDYLETQERLPDVRLSGYRQPVLNSPVYYETVSSLGYYQRNYAISNDIPQGQDYAAPRADTFHQFTLPQTFMGWLNVIPRAGGRLSYYGEATGAGGTNEATGRAVFNTGVEFTFKASQLWPGATNRLFDINGVRHIIEPSLNYVYVPSPSAAPSELPQFDYELPALRLLPIDYPDYNSLDSIDSQNVIRLGLRNRLQTKRAGKVENFFYWDVYTDWRLDPQSGQTTFSDLFGDLLIRPRSWMVLESLMRYDTEDGKVNVAYQNFTFRPNNVWSWGLGHLYSRDQPGTSTTSLGEGENALTSLFFLRLNENWGFRMAHQYDIKEHWLQQQAYSIYRDLRSWTAALTLRYEDNRTSPNDLTVAFTFSIKAAPKYGIGGDAVHTAGLIGY
ncbi:MAG TPA: LPS assembly protein LptD [Verrucomicrobiae bacterium]|nr:LPS assembly protein LptD [Verrucomicrobiae bacterium]